MTLHVVLGDGYMPSKELNAHLQDMKAKALADDDGFWFMIQAKAEPSDTDRALVKWLTAEPPDDIYFDAIGDKSEADKIYGDAQSFHKASRLAPKVVALMQKAKEGDDENEPEDADLLALFFSDDEDADEDDWLNDVISAVAEAGFPVFALNDGMTPIEPPDTEGTEAASEEEDPPTAIYNRADLEELELDALKMIALDKGVTVAPRSRKPTYIDAILGVEDEAPEVEIETLPPPTDISPTKDYADSNTHVGSTYTSGSTLTGSLHISATEVSGPAMVIVVYNGQVTSRVMTVDQAKALLS